jgi:hypothetical protein
MSWFRRRVTGFVFVADADDGPMCFAAAGKSIRNAADGAPWIVVDQAIESIVVAKWPGRLWRVAVLKAGAEQPAAYAKYTRAVGVEVIAEEPVSRLFGAHGEAVCPILERARTITLDDVALLRDAVREDAREAYSRAWNRWLGDSHDHTVTLAAGDSRSPIGAGFTVLHNLVVERARTLTNGAAVTTNDDDEVVLAPEWSATSDALLHAAMAHGAPELLSPADTELLTAALDRAHL